MRNLGLKLMMPCLITSCAEAKEVIHCPEQIQVNTQLTAELPGWSTGIQEAPHVFERISVSDDIPFNSMVPDEDDDKKVTWSIAPAEKNWMVCHYLFTNLYVYKQIPTGLTTCSVNWKKVGNQASMMENTLTCK